MPTRNELFAYVKATFGTEPDYPWPQEPEYAVLRHTDNGKWYGIVMSVPQSKLGLPGKGNVEIINVKIDPQKRDLYLQQKGCKLCYHMNKKHWLSLIMDDSLSDQSIQSLLSESYVLTAPRKKVA